MKNILVVDDELSMREFLSLLLEQEGYKTQSCADVKAARAAIDGASFDLIITDLKLPDGSGLDLLGYAKKADPDTEIIVITAFGTTETAVEAMKQGAYDYIGKPFKVDHITVTVAKSLEKAALSRENRELRRHIEAGGGHGEITSRSQKMAQVLKMADRVAPTSVSVLILGESGTGKELIANRVHNLSGRTGSFVPINCSAIPEGLMESELFGHMKGSFTSATADKPGLFEQAQGGTLFLDEVAEMPLSLQPKLLRALQEGKIKRVGGNREIEVDVRIISATNRNLFEEVQRGAFREDLYYRLNVVAVDLPPLRERKEDISLLAGRFLQKYNQAFGRQINAIAPETLRILETYRFPGNVRELENIVERAVALEGSNVLTVESLPEHMHGARSPAHVNLDDKGVDLGKILEQTEINYIRRALTLCDGNKTRAAELLGMSFRSFRYRLEKLEIG